jgi:hypothetical protein
LIIFQNENYGQAVAVGTGAVSSKSSGSYSTKMMQLLIYNTEKKRVTKGFNDR